MIDMNALIATLAAGTGPIDHMALDGEDDGAYLDWSTIDDDGLICLQVGDATGDAVMVSLTREQLGELQRRLALFLLTTAE